MSAFSVFKERLELRLKKYPELQHLWIGQSAVVTNVVHPQGGKVTVTPGNRPCSVLVSVNGGGFSVSEWVEFENALRALSGEKDA